MIFIISALLLAGAALAQPVEGPWEVMSADSGWAFRNVRVISLSPELVGMFIREENAAAETRIRYATYSLATQSLSGNPLVISYQPEWRAYVNDAMALPDGSWVCALTRSNSYWFEAGANEARLVRGLPDGPAVTDDVLLYSGQTLPIGWCWGNCSSLESLHLARRIGGGVLTAGSLLEYYDIGGGAREIDGYLKLHAFDSTFDAPEWVVEPYEPVALGSPEHFPVSLAADTALLISYGVSNNLLLLRADGQNPEEVEILGSTCNPHYPRTGLRTASGRNLILSIEWLADLVTIHELHDNGECSELASLNSAGFGVPSVTEHPEFGLGAVFAHPSSLTIARFDTNGQQVQPLGTFFWRDDEHMIVNASMSVDDESRVLVLWTERIEGSPVATRLRMGSVGWYTPLDVPRELPATPGRFALSAYPNPFNSTVTIRYELAHAADVDVSVYNLLGEKIAVLRIGREEAGVRTVAWRPEANGSGIYFVKVNTGKEMQMKKVVYLR